MVNTKKKISNTVVNKILKRLLSEVYYGLDMLPIIEQTHQYFEQHILVQLLKV